MNTSSVDTPQPPPLGGDALVASFPSPYFHNGNLALDLENICHELENTSYSSAGMPVPQPSQISNDGSDGSLFPPRRDHHQLKLSWRAGPITGTLSNHSDLAPLSIITRLSILFENINEYKRLLACRDSTAQRLIDLFQTLLDMSQIKATFKRQLVVAVQRLSRNSDLYPTCFSLDDIQPVSEFPVAAGSFGDIYKGLFQDECVCLKVIRIHQASRVDYLKKRLSHEAILWGQLSHENLLPFYGVYQFRSRLCLVAPWMENGDINDYLENHPNENRILLAQDVAAGVSYLHANDVIQGDLKGANVLINGSGRACLTDFGLSSVTDANIINWTSQSSVASKGGSVRWQAPELFDFHQDILIHNSKASDVYALSCVFYELFMGSVPFVEYARDSTVILKIQSGICPSRPPDSHISWSSWGLTSNLWSLMERCWNSDPILRPNMDGIIGELGQHLVQDKRPAEPKRTNPRARSAVDGHVDVFDVSQLETLIFETDFLASDLSHGLSQSLYMPDNVQPDSLHYLRNSLQQNNILSWLS
ncbi:kinase-like domain-containing protein [Collybia nuda]|uniref:Kinase-like domain-containing protein n=1 Tax=Collybia nuda TaxID=64659 RepID=A0A9P5XU01_9AGAR|nr:kinase-like domain-containing protein [Collybia nuda]